MSETFPFKDDGEMFFGTVHRPVAKVFFKSPQKDIWIKTVMIVDTGADFTILPHFLAEELLISLERDCVKDTTMGVGGEQAIYLCKTKIKAKIGSMERSVPIAFFDSNEVPALLGRLGFLETFDVEFSKKHKITFK
jgi:gag-polyprotein putative aspartyl protease